MRKNSIDLQPFYFVATELDAACAQLAPEYDYDWFDLTELTLRDCGVRSVISGQMGAGLARDLASGIGAPNLWHEAQLDSAAAPVDCLAVIDHWQRQLPDHQLLVVAAAAWGQKIYAGLVGTAQVPDLRQPMPFAYAPNARGKWQVIPLAVSALH